MVSEESENIKKRFELPSDICVCGHNSDAHYDDPEMSSDLPCREFNQGSPCPCPDYTDSGNGEIE